jgi:hypothetical protein
MAGKIKLDPYIQRSMHCDTDVLGHMLKVAPKNWFKKKKPRKQRSLSIKKRGY